MKNKVSSFLSSGLVLGTLALGILTSPAKAMAQDTLLGRAEIPFSFLVGSTVMPAGSYLFKRTASTLIEMTDRKTGESAFASALGDDKKRPENDGAVVFTHYGDQYFLRSLDVAGDKVAYNCWPGKKERALMRASIPHATGGNGPSTVALNRQLVLTR